MMVLTTVIKKSNFVLMNRISIFSKLIAILLLLILSGCYKNWYKPMGYIFKNVPKNGSPGFTLGWIHGCESGLGTQFGGAIYQTFYSWHRDPDITSSNPDIAKIRKRYRKELRAVNWNDQRDIDKNFSDYNTIFWGAHAFCRHSVLGTLQTANMNPALPSEERYDPMAHSIGNIWKITGKGDTRIGTGLW